MENCDKDVISTGKNIERRKDLVYRLICFDEKLSRQICRIASRFTLPHPRFRPTFLSSPLTTPLVFSTLTSAQICHKVHGALAEEHVLQFDDVRVIHALQYRNLRVKFPEVV